MADPPDDRAGARMVGTDGRGGGPIVGTDDRGGAPLAGTADRAAVPSVSKVMEVGLVMLFVSAVTISLYGGIVPDARTAAGEEVADRVLASASQQVQAAAPPNRTNVRSVEEVDLPETIRGRTYRVTVRNRTLVLDHPHPGVSAEAKLALPDSVVEVSGSWSSTERTWVVVESVEGGLAVRLVGGDPP